MTIRRWGTSGIRGFAVLGLALAVYPAGCKGPMERAAEEQLRDSVLASNKAYLNAVAAGPVVELSRETSRVEGDLPADRRAELEKMGGPHAYRDAPLVLGPDLMGKPPEGVNMTLRHAIDLAVRHNLEVRQARLLPAISETQITQAEAAFDPIFFTNFDMQKLDIPRTVIPTAFGVFGPTESETTSLTTGIRKPLTTGGQVTVQTEMVRNYSNNSAFGSIANPAFGYYDANVLVGLTQPLLRNFGSDVNESQISLARNARGESVQDMRRQLLETIQNTEQTYWNVVFARQRLLIQLRLLDRTIVDYETLKKRGGFDVSPVRLTEAGSFVEIRRTEVIRARQALRQASDALKRLINDPDLPITGEAMILPLDEPADLPIKYSLLDAVSTAMRRRPELQRAVLEISDASIRLAVADNARLPQLNLAASIRYNGTGHNVGDAYDNVTEGKFIDYLVGAQFEMPIGNRAPEALFRQRQIERQALTVSYQRAVQDVLIDVKNALRQLLADYEVIGSARAARLAASTNLRALEDQERIGAALTPEFLLDLKLTTQQRLADTETQEMQALTDYNTAVAKFYQTMGTLLERNNIEFRDDPQPE